MGSVCEKVFKGGLGLAPVFCEVETKGDYLCFILEQYCVRKEH